jgi:hypothetical protein
MSMAPPSLPEQGQLLSVRSRHGACKEDLFWWEPQGKKLAGRSRSRGPKGGRQVIAIVQPVEPVRAKPRRAEAGSLFGEQ